MISAVLRAEAGAFQERSSSYSSCKRYRYAYGWAWKPSASPLGWLIMNPRSLDGREGEHDDPQLVSLRARTEALGFGAMIVAGVYSWITVDQLELVRRHGEGVNIEGGEGSKELRAFLKLCPHIILGWGNGPNRLQSDSWHARRLVRVLGAIAHSGNQVYAMELTASRQPRDPQYLSETRRPFLVKPAQTGASLIQLPDRTIFDDDGAAAGETP